MKKIIVALLVSGLSLFSSATQAQGIAPTTPIAYSEKVPVEGSNSVTLYHHALLWTQEKFLYNPKSNVQANPETKEISLTGTSKIKMAAAKTSGPEQVRILHFNFRFGITEQGYSYNVSTFRVVPDEKDPTVMVPLEEYIKQLSEERTNTRTRNDRRVTAQANAVASDVASAFRSYMNSQPVVKDGEIGLPTDGEE
ncbi:DUF4468 domain-containing protein [Hymenobacter sp. BT188]|uniref:DUF4468 domain-containing protein n=1 Tax=Hymenobacter sp. BT188 TaxID=2763504 RepID=UPI001650EF85|nr:DUF4468 domain-containing protein [Hymenobacter sp. BT188]MBC6606099.1 DUF4468 domain-containing protein [Hymenobacter sp. BT188]